MATSSYQIEGAWNVGGKGESIWDRFCHTPGNITNNETGDIACDHYHRWREDVELMSSLNIPAYRFSISWPRIFPEGTGATNQAGLDYYSALVDTLLQAGIEPYVNLYHWDLPQTLQDRGGWPARATTEAFADYADTISRYLGDRVRHWMTFNEPIHSKEFISEYSAMKQPLVRGCFLSSSDYLHNQLPITFIIAFRKDRYLYILLTIFLSCSRYTS